MQPQSLFVAIVAACLVNGLTSPMLVVVWHLHPVWMPELLPATRETVFYGASLIVATATLLITALPAAIAERCGVALPGAMVIWLVGAVGLTLLGFR